MQDPIRPDQQMQQPTMQPQPQMGPAPMAPTPMAGTQKKPLGSGAKLVIILVCIFFGLPMIFVIIGMIIVAANPDLIDEIGTNANEYKLSTDYRESAKAVYDVATSKSARRDGLDYSDCRNMQRIADKYIDKAEDTLDGYCDNDEVELGANENGDDEVELYFENGSSCLTMTFIRDFKYIKAYSYFTGKGCEDSTHTVEIVGGSNSRASIEKKDEDVDVQQAKYSYTNF